MKKQRRKQKSKQRRPLPPTTVTPGEVPRALHSAMGRPALLCPGSRHLVEIHQDPFQAEVDQKETKSKQADKEASWKSGLPEPGGLGSVAWPRGWGGSLISWPSPASPASQRGCLQCLPVLQEAAVSCENGPGGAGPGSPFLPAPQLVGSLGLEALLVWGKQVSGAGVLGLL